MIYTDPARADSGTLLVSDWLSARQWETCLSPRRSSADPPDAWASRSIESLSGWIVAGLRAVADDDFRLLTDRQSKLLWQRVIASASATMPLITTRSAAGWADQARRRLRAWNIDEDELAAYRHDLDARVLLGWLREYDAVLRERRWSDSADLQSLLVSEPRIGSLQPRDLTTDLPNPTPAETKSLARLAELGWRLRPCRLPAPAAALRVEARDAEQEILAAARWAAARLARDPTERIAVVFGDVEHSGAGRVLADVLAPEAVSLTSRARVPVTAVGAHRERHDPVLGAAVTALELVSGRGTGMTFSRWLRNPFFCVDDTQAQSRALLDVRLRLQLFMQLDFVEAFRHGGLGAFVRNFDSGLHAALAAAIDLIGRQAPRLTPTRWAAVWQTLLTELGWPGRQSESQPQAFDRWDRALTELASLTAIVGEMTMPEALAELESILDSDRAPKAWPLSGAVLFDALEDVGPGYDAVWVAGMTARRWPRAPRSNALLPAALQRHHRMPLSSLELAYLGSRAAIERLTRMSSQVVFSWPSLAEEAETRPSPLIKHSPLILIENLPLAPDARLALRLIGSRPRETIEDPAPPLCGRRIPGGARVLSAQSRCPLHAFCRYRLAAAPLAPLERGLTVRQRGIIVHRALQLLLAGRYRVTASADTDEELAACADRALLEQFGPARSALRTLFELERARLIRLLSSLLAADRARSPFTVEGIEQKRNVDVGGFEISLRIDRLDRLDDGSVVIIDHKSGRGGQPGDWLAERLIDAQMPLYAVSLDAPVAAVAITELGPRAVRYRGIWTTQFPGRASPLPDGRSWSRQKEIWREQVESLIGEFAAGDTRLLPDHLAAARGAYGPLCRVEEQVALAEGWLTVWHGA